MQALIVDDQPDCAYALGKLLEQMGCDTLTACSGAMALELASITRPDAILLDLMLPDMPGYELARRLRNEIGLNSARIVAVSGSGLDSQQIAKYGIDAALLKPVEIQQLADVLGLRIHGFAGTTTTAAGFDPVR